MRAGNILLLILLFLGGIWIAIFALVKEMQQKAESGPIAEAIADQARRSAGELPILWDAPDFSYPDQDGTIITNQTLHGRVWICDFFFTGCASLCPIMTAKMSELTKTIANPKIQFISFSIDPDNDTPQALKDYAKMWHADSSRWHFLRTQRDTLAKTVTGMKTFVQAATADSQIQHSSIFILCDSEGKVRGVYDSLDASALQHLVIDALTLAGARPSEVPKLDMPWSAPEPARDGNKPGQALYMSRGCVACHAQERIAPPLDHLIDKSILMDDGRMIRADESYLRESILDPTAKVVAGYSRMMPSYRGQFTNDELDQLVKYIESLGEDDVIAPASPSSQPAGQFVGRAQR